MRGDIARLGRCTLISTEGEDTIKRSKPLKYAYEKEVVMCVYFENWFHIVTHGTPGTPISRSWTTFQRSVFIRQVSLSYRLKKVASLFVIDAYRGHARSLLKEFEAVRPSAIVDIIHSGETFELRAEIKARLKEQSMLSLSECIYGYQTEYPTGMCKRCGYMSSNDLCKACALLESLEKQSVVG